MLSAREPAQRRGDSVLAGAALLMVVCCVAGPAVIGAAAGIVIGGWLGLAATCVAVGTIGMLLYLRRGKGGC